jgi:hypothetical protein
LEEVEEVEEATLLSAALNDLIWFNVRLKALNNKRYIHCHGIEITIT